MVRGSILDYHDINSTHNIYATVYDIDLQIFQERSRVVNVASTLGHISLPLFAWYSMSKHAVIAFADTLRREMRSFGVRVSIVEPGGLHTPGANETLMYDKMCRTWSHTSDGVKNAYGPKSEHDFFWTISVFHAITCEHDFKAIIASSTAMFKLSENFDVATNDMIDAIHNAEPRLDYCEPEWMEAEDPLFILYTSGSTGKPKGIVHTIGGYLLYFYITFKYVFNYTDGDVFFSTADLGWMAAHTFTVYGSLANGCSIVLFEGTPIHPNPGHIWHIIDKWRVNIFNTAPTLIRSLMKFGDQYVKQYSRQTLKVLGTAGEPINPEAWLWFWEVVGDRRCP
ncbi:unnamed protein product, partial [Medioppia subpectinata]